MRPDVHLTPGCPWYGLSELRLPNVDWCEAQRCALVVEPANTWSNLGYVVVGIVLYWLVRHSRSAHLRFFAPAAVFVGLASGIYHASYTFALQILDFVAMYVFCYLLLGLNLRRLGLLGADDWRRRFAQAVLATTVLTIGLDFLEIPIQGIVFVLIVAIVGTEVAIRRRGDAGQVAWFVVAVGLLTAGAVFSVLDVTRTWCDPHHPVLQGHAIWHLLSAASLLAAFMHYRQYEGVLAEDIARAPGRGAAAGVVD